MDWTITAAAVIAAWMMLSVFTGERISRQQQIAKAIAAAKAASAEQAMTVVK
jgi:hypothetical protein